MTGKMFWALMGVAVLAAPLAMAAGSRRSGSFADGGFYVVGAEWGGSLAQRRVQVTDDINDWLRQEKGKDHFIVLQLEDGTKWRAGQASHDKLRQWLEQTDLALIDVVHFWEENVYNAHEWLDPLYDIVKEYDADLPVYVWYSAPMGPRAAQADGYWYDFYGRGYTQFRNITKQYLATDKPFGMCVDVSYCTLPLDVSLQSAREQVMLCWEHDIPTYYFAAAGRRGSPCIWHGEEPCEGAGPMMGQALLAPARNLAFSALELQRRVRAPWSLKAGDFFWGEIIELAADVDGLLKHEWDGLGAATVYGFQSMQIEAGVVRGRGDRPVSLDYQYWSHLPLENGRLHLEPIKGAAWPQVEMSRCGNPNDWRELSLHEEGQYFDLGDPGREFRIRLTFHNAQSVFAGGRIAGRVSVPEGSAKAVEIYPDYCRTWHGRVYYRQDLGIGLWRTLARVHNREHLEPGPSLSMRGREGEPAHAEVVQKITSTAPLAEIAVRLTGQHNRTGLGGSSSLGISLDGENILVEGVAEGDVDRGGTWRGVHVADLQETAGFTEVREFYVHMRQSNGTGVRSHISSSLHQLEIEARVAEWTPPPWEQ